MITGKPITSQSADLEKIQTLYVTAFPENERRPFHLLLDDATQCSEIVAFYEQERFCGFMSLLTIDDITHIIYFAIEQSMRGGGLGAQALALLRQRKPCNRLLADIEAPASSAENNSERMRRKQFYLQNGYEPTEVAYVWRGEAYEILSSGGGVTKKEFWDFWKSVERVNGEFAKF